MTASWMPSANLDSLKARALLLKKVRDFFTEQNFLELETPLLSPFASVDIHLESFQTEFHQNNRKESLYLQTSPEFFMKRFLAAYPLPIFQICKAFRNGELGNRHNPEFTLCEWYLPHKNHFDLMNQCEELIHRLLGFSNYERISYRDLFLNYLKLDPFQTDLHELNNICQQNAGFKSESFSSKDICLDYLFMTQIETKLVNHPCLFITDYPASQAALAKLNPDGLTAARFELYIHGIELINAFYECTDAEEQERRFLEDLQERKIANKKPIPYDIELIHALKSGMVECSGAALGFDRLVMLALDKRSIKEVMAFDFK